MAETMQLPILGAGISGRSRAVSAQKRQNLFLEIKSEKDKSTLVAYGTPGLKYFTTLGASATRGIWWFQALNRLYAVSYNQLVEIAPDGTVTNRGTLLTTSGTVSMADNGTQLMIVDGANGYILSMVDGSLNRITSDAFPGANTVTFQDGYFICNNPGTGQWFISALYDGTDLVLDHRVRLPRSDEERFVHVQAEVIRDEDGRPLRVKGTAQDITERKRLEAELAERYNELDQFFNLTDDLYETTDLLLGANAASYSSIVSTLTSAITGIATENYPPNFGIGGITQTWKTIQYLLGEGIETIPHTPFVGPALIAAIHMIAAMDGDVLCEHRFCDLEGNPLGEAAMSKNGRLSVPQGPGLGVEIDEKAMARFRKG